VLFSFSAARSIHGRPSGQAHGAGYRWPLPDRHRVPRTVPGSVWPEHPSHGIIDPFLRDQFLSERLHKKGEIGPGGLKDHISPPPSPAPSHPRTRLRIMKKHWLLYAPASEMTNHRIPIPFLKGLQEPLICRARNASRELYEDITEREPPRLMQAQREEGKSPQGPFAVQDRLTVAPPSPAFATKCFGRGDDPLFSQNRDKGAPHLRNENDPSPYVSSGSAPRTSDAIFTTGDRTWRMPLLLQSSAMAPEISAIMAGRKWQPGQWIEGRTRLPVKPARAGLPRK